MNNTRKARQVVAEARDLLGGNGILLDFHVMRHMADIEALHGYEGTETIQTLIVGRDITGIGASLDISAPFERELNRRGVQTISYDARGIGESTSYTWPRRMPGVARTAERLIDALRHETVDVFGVSLGGVVAQQLAHQAPRRVRRLVLAATGPGLGGVPGSPRVLWVLATPRRYYQPDYYRRVAADIYGGTARRDPDALLHGSLARFNAPAEHAWLCGPAVFDRGMDERAVAALPAPTDARPGWRRRSDRAGGQWPDPRSPHQHVVRGGGHLFVLEDPAAVAARVSEFLSEPRAATSAPPG
jgi:poly(3-hydroxyoctanoate) depolymerase